MAAEANKPRVNARPHVSSPRPFQPSLPGMNSGTSTYSTTIESFHMLAGDPPMLSVSLRINAGTYAGRVLHVHIGDGRLIAMFVAAIGCTANDAYYLSNSPVLHGVLVLVDVVGATETMLYRTIVGFRATTAATQETEHDLG